MNNFINQAVILAGGMGTRLKPFTDSHPKPMYRFNNVPFIEYLIKQVKEFGIENIILLLGYRAQEIMDYLGNGEKYEVSITYDITPIEYDTGERLLSVRNLLEERFLLMYCDNYCPIDFKRLIAEAASNNSDIQITAYANKDLYTSDNLQIADNGLVLVYDKSRTIEGLKGVDIGYAIIKSRVLDLLDTKKRPLNFEKEVYPLCVNSGTLFATVTEHRYYSVGSWERIEMTKQFFDQKKTVFLDRDGTINVRAPKACYIEKPEDFVWLDGAQEAIKLLKGEGYRIILISNQPGIARGNLSESTLKAIHDKMQNDLRENVGCEIDAIYYCPHNWDEGCDCRKPKPGMFYQAQRDYSLNLLGCVMIGDDERDMEAALNARIKGILVDEEYCLLDAVKELIS